MDVEKKRRMAQIHSGRRWGLMWFAGIACTLGMGAGLSAGIAPSEVLVVYNSQSVDGGAVLAHYLAAHPTIPASHVVDLNDGTIADVSTVTQSDYNAKIAQPIRDHLVGGFGPTPESIVSICLIKGIPHRVSDTDYINVGDNPNSANTEFITRGDATYAAVDAELVLLWQDLFEGETGGMMDSLSDNAMDNPYHQSSDGIETFSRSNIQIGKSFTNVSNVAWRLSGAGGTMLTPGDIYLVCRIDAGSLSGAMAIIDRAQGLVVHKPSVHFLFDEHQNAEFDNLPLFSPPPTNQIFYGGDDYEEARDLLIADGWNVTYDDTTNFVSFSEFSKWLVGYSSYGRNHSPNQPGSTYIQGFLLAPGAVFNTAESYNARAFNGLGTLFSQEQIADFIVEGGTFGIGSVWEPFAFSLPDGEFLLVNFFVKGLTFAEAAYTCLPALSWQQIAVGDPLAVVAVDENFDADQDEDGDVDGIDFSVFAACFNNAGNPPRTIGCDAGDVGLFDFDCDGDVDGLDFSVFASCFNKAEQLPRPCLP
jgi:uncharacterized protein (TIGR03790 family)